MSRLPSLKPKEVIRKFEKLGFIKDRQSGSHVILFRKSDKRRAVIPLHLRDLPKGTLKAILRETGVREEEFIRI